VKISVVIPCYNYEGFLPSAIESVLTGSRPPDEIIVVDDGSTDGSAAVAERYLDVELVLKTNGGMASALNAGITRATGDVVVLLDADDMAEPGRLAWIENAFEDPTVAMAWHPLRIQSANHKNRLLVPSSPLPDGDLAPAIAARGLSSFALTSGIAVRRSALDAIGAIPEDQFRISSEGYFVRTLPFVGRVAATPEPLGVYRSHANSQIRAVAAHDASTIAEKLGEHLGVADAEHALLSSSATAAGHPITVERLRALDRCYLDYHRWHARLGTSGRRAAWRAIRGLRLDFPPGLAHRRLQRFLAGAWTSIMPARAALVSFLIRHDFELTGTVRQLARVYWFQRALMESARCRLRHLPR
jgi:glycosyltransferase involved in cell wall biosynthesis